MGAITPTTDQLELLRDELFAAVPNDGGGVTRDCRGELGLMVMTGQWGHVDAMIAHIGAWLREKDLRLGVGILVARVILL
ncbi:MAG: hypothetical protein AB7O24_08055 [Kofleriaceae bacterium]